MTTKQIKYVQTRYNRGGTERHYSRQPNQPMIRLPDDRAKRVALVIKLNEQYERDKKKKDTKVTGEVDWVIDRYEDSDRYADLAPESRRVYERWLAKIRDI